jgi:hypothetical protein
MTTPNFSELQFQQVVNTAIGSCFMRHGRSPAFPFVPSLVQEFDLGWDTAFHIPSLIYDINLEQEGCNLFLQYKLSSLLSTRRAREWAHWGRPYHRFRIPYAMKDESGRIVGDYHQWDRLKELADNGHGVFYATNTTISRADLVSSYSDSEGPLKYVAFLDVARVTTRHESVTFEPSSSQCKLHSEIQEATLGNAENVLEASRIWKKMASGYAAKKLYLDLKSMCSGDSLFEEDIDKIVYNPDGQLGSEPELHRMWGALAFVVKKHMGASLFWIPTERL